VTASIQTELQASLAFARDFMDQRNYTQARLALLECLPLSRSVNGSNARETMNIIERLGICLYQLGQYVEAIDYLGPVYKFHLGRTYKTPEPVLFVAKPYGLSLAGAGHHKDAIEVLNFALDTSIALYGPNSSTTWLLRSKLSTSLRAAHEWRMLIALHETQTPQPTEVNEGPNRTFAQIMLRNIAVGYLKTGAPDMALHLIFQVLKADRARHDLKTASSLDDLCFAAQVLQRLKRYDEATAALEKARELSIPVFGANGNYRNMVTDRLRVLREDIARAHRHQERLAEHAAAKARRLAAEAAVAEASAADTPAEAIAADH
jgi:tetratricopeptide (TPR) repeat protein